VLIDSNCFSELLSNIVFSLVIIFCSFFSLVLKDTTTSL